MRIVFMGTPEFAVPSLRALHEAAFDVVGVITAPDRPKGRGKKLATSPVKDYALEQNLNILQPTNLKDGDFLNDLKALKADLQVVVAFRMLPEAVWDMPRLGTFNLHGSLLPSYRGAAPINWAIINGETETGVTTFFLKHAIDTGNIIFQEKEAISSDDNVGSLYERLMDKGSALVVKTAKAIESDNYKVYEQSAHTDDLPAAPKISKEICKIEWTKNSKSIVNFVRGLSPYPAAWTTFNEKKFKVFKVSDAEANGFSLDSLPGDFTTDDTSYLKVKTGDGAVFISELQPEGKKRMNIKDFLRGNKI